MYKFEIEKPRLQRVVNKIVRGLYWHHNGQRVPDGHVVTPYMWNPNWSEQDKVVFSSIPILSIGSKEVFEYRYGEVEGDRNKVLVAMSFYGASNVVVSTVKPENYQSPQPASAPMEPSHSSSGVR